MSELDQRVHIGVFGDGGWIKNTIVQLAAACIVENAVIHVVDLPATPYFRRCKNTIVVRALSSSGYSFVLTFSVSIGSWNVTS